MDNRRYFSSNPNFPDWEWDAKSRTIRPLYPDAGSNETEPAPRPATTVPTEELPYQALREILDDVMDQACIGKGKDRHARDGETWDEQVWSQITRLLGDAGPGFLLGQAIKKIVESLRLDSNHAETELLGAMNYTAMRIWQLRRDRDRT